MNNIETKRIIHQSAQKHIQETVSSIKSEPVTRIMFDSLLMAFMSSNKLNGELFEEIERLKAVAK